MCESNERVMQSGSPPHTRGTLVHVARLFHPKRITPAHAGNTLMGWIWGMYQLGSPPHTRGTLLDKPRTIRFGGITPAHAGNTGDLRCRQECPQDHPRTRGEHWSKKSENLHPNGSPPHTRGTPNNSPLSYLSNRITPAHAGNTFSRTKNIAATQDHPRTRGEHDFGGGSGDLVYGSPPHTRGTLVEKRCIALEYRITPAHAGNTIVIIVRQITLMGSPPHTRGTLRPPHCGFFASRITPAHAGNTKTPLSPDTWSTGSPPHTRGTRFNS